MRANRNYNLEFLFATPERVNLEILSLCRYTYITNRRPKEIATTRNFDQPRRRTQVAKQTLDRISKRGHVSSSSAAGAEHCRRSYIFCIYTRTLVRIFFRPQNSELELQFHALYLQPPPSTLSRGFVNLIKTLRTPPNHPGDTRLFISLPGLLRNDGLLYFRYYCC